MALTHSFDAWKICILEQTEIYAHRWNSSALFRTNRLRQIAENPRE